MAMRFRVVNDHAAGFALSRRIEPRLDDALSEGRAAVDEAGLLSLVAPRNGRALTVDLGAGTFTRPSPHEHEVEVTAERPLLLVPSLYVWPSVRVTCDEPWPLALFYPAPFIDREAARELAPRELVRSLRAAADPSISGFCSRRA